MTVRPFFEADEGWWVVDGHPASTGDRIAISFYAVSDQDTRTSAMFFPDDLVEIAQSP